MLLYLFIALLTFLLGRFILSYRVIYHGPNSANITKEIYQWKDKCWKFVPEVVICPINSEIIAFGS